MCLGGAEHLKAGPPLYHGTHRGGRVWCFPNACARSGHHACAQPGRAVGRSSPDEAANQIEVAVAHFYFSQAVRFANILPEVPSKPSLFAPCVESSFGECISIKISSADFVKVIKCYGRSVIKSWSPFWKSSCFCSWKEGLDSALVVVPSLLRSSPPLKPWGQLGGAVSPLPHLPNLLNLELLRNTSVAWRSLPYKRNVNDYCLLAKPVKKEIPVQYLQQGSLILFFLLHCHIEWFSGLPGFCGIVLTGLGGQSLSPAYKGLIVQIYLLPYVSACSFWSVVFTLGGGEHLTLLASSVRYRTLILFRFPSTKSASCHVR